MGKSVLFLMKLLHKEGGFERTDAVIRLGPLNTCGCVHSSNSIKIVSLIYIFPMMNIIGN